MISTRGKKKALLRLTVSAFFLGGKEKRFFTHESWLWTKAENSFFLLEYCDNKVWPTGNYSFSLKRPTKSVSKVWLWVKTKVPPFVSVIGFWLSTAFWTHQLCFLVPLFELLPLFFSLAFWWPTAFFFFFNLRTAFNFPSLSYKGYTFEPLSRFVV